MDIAQFEKFLLDRIKVDGKTGWQVLCYTKTPSYSKKPKEQLVMVCLPLIVAICTSAGVLGDNVKIQKDKNKLSVTTEVQMSKR